MGELRGNNLTAEETNNEFKLEWTEVDEALGILEKDKSDDYESKFIKIRDMSIINFYNGKINH